jgi:hypothetical protein
VTQELNVIGKRHVLRGVHARASYTVSQCGS